jgi:hypothetical protein
MRLGFMRLEKGIGQFFLPSFKYKSDELEGLLEIQNVHPSHDRDEKTDADPILYEHLIKSISIPTHVQSDTHQGEFLPSESLEDEKIAMGLEETISHTEKDKKDQLAH